jgi:GTPase SAR1 family protein
LQAIIFVIDSGNRERMPEAQDELVKLLSEKELKDACLLILANKQVRLHAHRGPVLKTELCSGTCKSRPKLALWRKM